ncbi:MAG: hypothetical protein AAGJ97_15695, partial [Planctomycetota bacterium]
MSVVVALGVTLYAAFSGGGAVEPAATAATPPRPAAPPPARVVPEKKPPEPPVERIGPNRDFADPKVVAKADEEEEAEEEPPLRQIKLTTNVPGASLTITPAVDTDEGDALLPVWEGAFGPGETSQEVELPAIGKVDVAVALAGVVAEFPDLDVVNTDRFDVDFDDAALTRLRAAASCRVAAASHVEGDDSYPAFFVRDRQTVVTAARSLTGGETSWVCLADADDESVEAKTPLALIHLDPVRDFAVLKAEVTGDVSDAESTAASGEAAFLLPTLATEDGEVRTSSFGPRSGTGVFVLPPALASGHPDRLAEPRLLSGSFNTRGGDSLDFQWEWAAGDEGGPVGLEGSLGLLG